MNRNTRVELEKEYRSKEELATEGMPRMRRQAVATFSQVVPCSMSKTGKHTVKMVVDANKTVLHIGCDCEHNTAEEKKAAAAAARLGGESCLTVVMGIREEVLKRTNDYYHGSSYLAFGSIDMEARRTARRVRSTREKGKKQEHLLPIEEKRNRWASRAATRVAGFPVFVEVVPSGEAARTGVDRRIGIGSATVVAERKLDGSWSMNEMMIRDNPGLVMWDAKCAACNDSYAHPKLHQKKEKHLSNMVRGVRRVVALFRRK